MCYYDDMSKKAEKQVRISTPAYEKLREISKDEKYRTRGITGVVDDLVLGKFTTPGSGRVLGSKNLHHKGD